MPYFYILRGLNVTPCIHTSTESTHNTTVVEKYNCVLHSPVGMLLPSAFRKTQNAEGKGVPTGERRTQKASSKVYHYNILYCSYRLTTSTNLFIFKFRVHPPPATPVPAKGSLAGTSLICYCLACTHQSLHDIIVKHNGIKN